MTGSILGIVSRVRTGVIRGIFSILDRVVPVRDDFWCFCTWDGYPHTLDNPRAVFEEIKDDPSIRKVVLQKESSAPAAQEGESVQFVAAETLKGAYYLARCRVVVIGYALFGMSSYSERLNSSRHHVIQLWHGVPLKRIGRFFPDEGFWEDETKHYSATVCSSEQDRDVMARAFAPIPRDRVWRTGLPRNSLLLKDATQLPADYREHLGSLDQVLDGRRLVLYAPTWRESPESLYSFSGEELSAIEDVLSKHEAVFGIRGHPNVREHEAYSARSGTQAIVSVNDFPDPNVLLRRTDVLITDYSSIYIDFLLLDRPILHFAYDLEDYRRERGFLYDPGSAFGGPRFEDFVSLLNHLETVLSDPDRDRDQRRRARQIFHEHPDEAASEVVKRVRGLVGNGAEAMQSDGTRRKEPVRATASPGQGFET